MAIIYLINLHRRKCLQFFKMNQQLEIFSFDEISLVTIPTKLKYLTINNSTFGIFVVNNVVSDELDKDVEMADFFLLLLMLNL